MILMRLTNSTLAFSLPSSFPSLSLSLSLSLFCTKSWFPEWESCILGRPTSPVMFARSIRLWALIVESVNGDAAQLRSDLTWYRQKSVHFNAVTKQKKNTSWCTGSVSRMLRQKWDNPQFGLAGLACFPTEH